MATDAEVLAAFKALNNGIRSVGLTNAFNRARKKIDSFKDLEETERRSQFKEIAPQIAMDLAQQGADSVQINNLINTFRPENYTSWDHFELAKSLEEGNTEEVKKRRDDRSKEIEDRAYNLTKQNFDWTKKNTLEDRKHQKDMLDKRLDQNLVLFKDGHINAKELRLLNLKDQASAQDANRKRSLDDKKEMADYQAKLDVKTARQKEENKWGTYKIRPEDAKALNDSKKLILQLDVLKTKSRDPMTGELYASRIRAFPVVGDAAEWLKSNIGSQSSGYTQFIQAYYDMFNAYRKKITGAQASIKEIRWLEKAVANPGTHPDAFDEILDKTRLLALIADGRRIKLMEAQGTNIRGYKRELALADDATKKLRERYKFETSLDDVGHIDSSDKKVSNALDTSTNLTNKEENDILDAI